MEELIEFYESKVKSYTLTQRELKRKIYIVGTIRIILFITATISIWLCWHLGWQVWMGVLIIYLIPFLLLIVYHNKLFEKKTFIEALILLNSNERKAIDYDYSAFDGGSDQVNSQHAFSLDLDLFGDHSLFQSMNRTVTWMGRLCLIDWLKQPLNNKTEIQERQRAVQELALKTHFRQYLYVTGIVQKGSEKDFERLKELANMSTNFSDNWFWKVIIWLIPILWIVVIVGCSLSFFPFTILGTLFTISFLIANWHTKKINKIYQSGNTVERLLSTYARLIKLIENEVFESSLIKKSQSCFIINQMKASNSIQKLSACIGALDQRYSLGGILFNLFYLRDLRQIMSLEKWMKTYAGYFDVWFEALAQIDALCSLGSFSFNHPNYIFPEIADRYFQMEGKALGHPLVHREKCVRNDLFIQKNPYFLVITGANMAGKSTYLRTVGVSFVLACIGLPVYAESLIIYPAALVTSLRTADSLAANESYFFAELKRLKMIIDRLNSGEEMFIILDEILRGTNSKDKQKGSLGLVKQLIDKKTCGIIATHDLLLGELENEFPDKIKNFHFEADIQNDQLVFTYKLREGIAQNMNATFLMKQMGITVE